MRKNLKKYTKNVSNKTVLKKILCGIATCKTKKIPRNEVLRGIENKGMFLLNLQLAARNFRTKRILVRKESAAGLLTEQASANHLTQ